MTRPIFELFSNLPFKPFKYIKKFLPKTLFARSLMIILIPIVLIQGVTAYVFIDRHWSWVTQHLGRTLSFQMLTLVDMMNRKDPLLDLTKQRFSITTHVEPLSPMLHRQWEKHKKHSSWDERYFEEILVELFKDPLFVRMTEDLIIVEVLQHQKLIRFIFPKKHLFSRTTPIFLFWSLGTPFIFFIVAALFMRNQVRPIRRLANAAYFFGKTQEIKPFKPEGSYEVRKAGVAFHQMQERIVRQITQRTEMLAGVSHDLRTPLTRIELQLALMKSSKEIRGVRSDIREMNKTIDEYINFVRVEREGTSHLINLSSLLNTILKKMGDSKMTSLKFHCELPKNLKLIARKHSLERCFTNLLTNAQNHAKTIWIQGNLEDDLLHIMIEDDGPGIPVEQREKVFQAFYRVGASPKRKTKGSGLGLAIAYDAIISHGGSISLGNSHYGGLKVDIYLPT